MNGLESWKMLGLTLDKRNPAAFHVSFISTRLVYL